MIIFCSISIFIWILISLYFVKVTKDIINPLTVTCLLFVVTFPLKLIASKFGFSVVNSMYVKPEIINQSILITNLSMLLIILGSYVNIRKTLKINSFNILNLGSIPSFRPFYLLLFGFLSICFRYGLDANLSVLSINKLALRIEERASERLYSGFSALFLDLAIFLFTIFALKLFKRKKINIIYYILIPLMSLYSLAISGSKWVGLILPSILSIAYVYKIQSKGIISLRYFLLGIFASPILIAFTGFLVGVNSFIIYNVNPFVYAFQQFTNAFDSADNLIIILSRAQDSIVFGYYGLNLFINSIVFPFVPRLIWPEKPLLQSNQIIMRDFIQERFTSFSGETISPSFQGEMILSGGIFLLILGSFILGYFLSYIYINAKLKGGLYSVFYIWNILNIFNYFRSGFAIFPSFIKFILVTLFTISLFNFILTGQKIRFKN